MDRPTDLSSPEWMDFHQLVELLQVALCFMDGDGNVLVWNKAAEEITGYPREHVVGRNTILQLLYPDAQYRNQVLENFQEIIKNKLHSEDVETKIRREDDETRIVSLSFRGFFDNNGKLTGSVAIGRDVTEQVRLRKELERHSEHLEALVRQRTRSLSESEHRLFAIIQGSPEGIVVTDLNWSIIECNQAALQLYWANFRDQLIGRDMRDLVAAKDRKFASGTFVELAGKGIIRNLRYSMLRSNGQEYPAESSLSVVRDAAGSPLVYVTVIRDLTSQNEIEERLRKAERMAVIGETVAMVGHDLRNPLQTIASALYILDQKYESTTDQDTKEILEMIRSGLDYADNIVKELLDYSREIRLDLAETSIKKITQAALLQLKILEKITVQDLTQDQPSILVDPAKTQRVLINLITNAIDAMPDGGKLTITSREIDSRLEIEVSDTGVGISEDVMKNLWKPLKTTKSKGMGLGLAICKRIVEAHDGSIDVESTPGKGSTFTIRLPLQPRASTPAIDS